MTRRDRHRSQPLTSRRRGIALVIALTTAAALVGVGAPAQVAHAQGAVNLLVDGTFEDPNLRVAWLNQSVMDAGVTVENSSTVAHSRNGSLHMKDTSSSGLALLSGRNFITVNPAQPYVVSFWARQEVGSTYDGVGSVLVQQLDAKGNVCPAAICSTNNAVNTISMNTTRGSWQSYRQSLSLRNDASFVAASIVLSIRGTQTGTKNEFYLDDLNLSRPNLVSNGDAEDSTVPAVGPGWTSGGGSGAATVVETVNGGDGRPGSGAVAFHIVDTDPSSAVRYLNQSQLFTVSAASTYLLSFTAKQMSGTGKVFLSEYSASGTFLVNQLAATISSSSPAAWKYQELTIGPSGSGSTVTWDAATAKVELYFYPDSGVGQNTGEIYLDNIRMDPVPAVSNGGFESGLTGWTAGGDTGSTQTIEASPTAPYSGAASAHLVDTSKAALSYLTSSPVAIQDYKDYKISYAYKAPPVGNDKPTVVFYYYDGNDVLLGKTLHTITPSAESPAAWHTASITMGPASRSAANYANDVIPPGSASFRIRVYAAGNSPFLNSSLLSPTTKPNDAWPDGTGEVYFDGFSAALLESNLTIGGAFATTSLQPTSYDGIGSVNAIAFLTTPRDIPTNVKVLGMWGGYESHTKLNFIVQDSCGERFRFDSYREGPTYASSLELSKEPGNTTNPQANVSADSYSGGTCGTAGRLDYPLSLTGVQIVDDYGVFSPINLDQLVLETGDRYDRTNYHWEISPVNLFEFRQNPSLGGFGSVASLLYSDWSANDAKPFVRYGDLLPAAGGSFTVKYTVREGFNGPLVEERSAAIASYSSASDARTKLEFDTMAQGDYWVDAVVLDSTGRQVNRAMYQMRLTRGISGSPTVITDPTVESFHVTGEETNGFVYSPGPATTLNLTIHKPAGFTGTFTWSYEIHDFSLQAVASGGPSAALTFDASDKASTSLTVPAVNATAGTAYWLDLTLLKDGQPVDVRTALFGYASSPSAAPFDPSQAITAADLKAQDKVLSSEQVVVFANYQGGLDRGTEYREWIDHLAAQNSANQIDSIADVIVQWSDFEPLPGVYQFSLFDDVLSYAASKNVKVRLGIWFPGNTKPFGLAAQASIDAWGRQPRSIAPTYAPTNTVAVARIKNIYHVLVQQYRNNPTVVGWDVTPQGLDYLYLDAVYKYIDAPRADLPPIMQTFDYSSEARQAFQDYLQASIASGGRGLTLSQVNARYGTSYTAFGQVELPRPTYTSDVPDLRLWWQDFMDFKEFALKQTVANLQSDLRSLDSKRMIFLYQSATASQDALRTIDKANGVWAASGGMDGVDSQLNMGMMWKDDVTYRSESHEVPAPTTYRQDTDAANLLGWGGSTLLNHNQTEQIRWLTRWADTNAASNDRYVQWQKIFKTMQSSRPVNESFGYWTSEDTQHLYARTDRDPVLGFGVYDAIKPLIYYDHIIPYYMTRATEGPKFASVKTMFVDTDTQVMSSADANGLAGYVQGGRSLVLTTESAQYAKDGATPGLSRPLLGAVGFTPASGATWSIVPQQEQTVGIDTSAGACPASATNCPFANDPTLNVRFENEYSITVDPAWAAAANYTVLARFADNNPAIVSFKHGTGTVVLFLGKVDWGNYAGAAGFGVRALADVDQWAGTKPLTQLTITQGAGPIGATEYYISNLEDLDNNRYVTIERDFQALNNTRETASQVEAYGQQSVKIAVLGLKYDGSYTATNLLTGATATYTRAQLEAGGSGAGDTFLTPTFYKGQAVIYRIRPLAVSNLVNNGDFESGSLSPNWVGTAGNGTTKTTGVVSDTTRFFGGTYDARLVDTSGAVPRAGMTSTVVPNPIAIDPTKTYRLFYAYRKTVGTGSSYLAVRQYTSAGGYNGITATTTGLTSPSWTGHEVTLGPPGAGCDVSLSSTTNRVNVDFGASAGIEASSETAVDNVFLAATPPSLGCASPS